MEAKCLPLTKCFVCAFKGSGRHSGPGWGNFVTGPQIFVFKIEPGARSYMPGDPFGPKKPSISPYWDFAVTWQTSSWLKNGDFSRKKWYLLYGP